MPIKINLLAEEKAAEEMRRRDPAKRAMFVAGGAICVVLLYSVWLQLCLFNAKSTLHRWESDWSKLEKDYKRVSDQMRQIAEVEQKLSALHTLASNRFLWGPLLNALQQTTADEVEMVRLRSEQTFTVAQTAPPKSGAPGTAGAKPASTTEKDVLFIEARALGESPELQVNKFRDTIASFSYFKDNLQKVDGVKLIELARQDADAQHSDEPHMRFTIQCLYQERTRAQ